jgi:hypothetical protein
VLADALALTGHKGKLVPRMLLFGAITAANYYLLLRDTAAWPQFITQIPHLDLAMRIALSTAVVGLAIYWSTIHGSFAHNFLDLVKITSLRDELAKRIRSEGYEGIDAWASSVKASASGSASR